jgi:hypothetical protein
VKQTGDDGVADVIGRASVIPKSRAPGLGGEGPMAIIELASLWRDVGAHGVFLVTPERVIVTIYDTTLRDGTQGTGISFSTLDKIRVAERLDDFGVHYIEGGWPGSNPKDAAFFQEAAKRTWKNAKITAFGMTRRGKIKVEDDPQVQMLLDAQTPAVTVVGKTWPLHVTEVFQVSLEENLAMIADTVAY